MGFAGQTEHTVVQAGGIAHPVRERGDVVGMPQPQQHALSVEVNALRKAAAAAGVPVGHRAYLDEHLPEPEANSIPPAASFRAALGRIVRTTAPIVAADVAALVLAGAVAQVVLGHLHAPAAQALGWRLALLSLLPLVVGYALSGLYSEVWTHVVIELRQLSHVSTVWLLAAAVGGVSAWPLPVWCLAAWPAVLVLVPLARTVAHAVCQRHPWWGYPTLVIGSGAGAETVVQALLAAPRYGLRPVLLSDPLGTCVTAAVPVVNDPPTLESIVRAEVIRHAVVSLPELPHRRLSAALDQYGGLVPHLLVLSDCSTVPTLWSAARTGGRLSGIEVRNGLLLFTLQGVKRALDAAAAATALVVAAPVLAAAAAAVKLTSPGPVLFAHTRIGRRGRPFRAWKLRTMHVDGDAILRRHLERDPAALEEWHRGQKLQDDPRVSRVGRLLRRTSLDELPQLWNVLRGEMSLVGPRPIVEGEVWRYGKVFRAYATVKPGITGLWQVSGRNDLSYDDRVALDEFYIRHWSLWLDAYIVAKTVVTLLSRRGAC